MTQGSSAVEGVRAVIARVAASLGFSKGSGRKRLHDAFGVCDDCNKAMSLMPPDFETLRCPECGKNRPRRGGAAPMGKAAPPRSPASAAKPTAGRDGGAVAGKAPLTLQRPKPGAATSSPPAREPEGKVVLGKTKRGKPVYASGAEATKYSDRDHAEAAVFHVQAHAHHAKQARVHGESAEGGDGHWTRSEEHHRDGERHGKLADHHEELARHHLSAAGLSETLEVDLSGPDAAVAKKPGTPQAQREAKQALAGRSHHDHPGGLSDQDRDAYAKLGGVDG
jgi:hypothetical protein